MMKQGQVLKTTLFNSSLDLTAKKHKWQWRKAYAKWASQTCVASAFSGKCFWTSCTFGRWLPMILAHVLQHVALVDKAFRAQSATEQFFRLAQGPTWSLRMLRFLLGLLWCCSYFDGLVTEARMSLRLGLPACAMELLFIRGICLDRTRLPVQACVPGSFGKNHSTMCTFLGLPYSSRRLEKIPTCAFRELSMRGASGLSWKTRQLWSRVTGKRVVRIADGRALDFDLLGIV